MRRNHLAILLSAASLVLGLSAIAPERAEARRKNPAQASCEARGYLWSNDYGCGDKSCTWDGKTYSPGSEVLVRITAQETRLYVCNGFNGTFEAIRAPRLVPQTTLNLVYY